MKRSASELALEELLETTAIASPEVIDAEAEADADADDELQNDNVFKVEHEVISRSPKRSKNFQDSADACSFFGDIDFNFFLRNNRVRNRRSFCKSLEIKKKKKKGIFYLVYQL